MSNCIYFENCQGTECSDCPYFVANFGQAPQTKTKLSITRTV